MEHEPILQVGSNRILLRNTYHEPFTVTFTDKCKLVLGCIDGAQGEDTASVSGFQAEIYITNAAKVENAEKGYRGRNSQAAMKVLDSFQINSKLAWNCHQSLVKLVEHKQDANSMGARTNGN
jgi:hypothetical protein